MDQSVDRYHYILNPPKSRSTKKIDYHNRHNPSKHSGHQFFLVDIGTRFLLLHPLEDSRHQNNKKKKRSPAANDPASRMHPTKQGGGGLNTQSFLIANFEFDNTQSKQAGKGSASQNKIASREVRASLPSREIDPKTGSVSDPIQSTSRRGRRNWLAAFLEEPADFGGGSSSSPAQFAVGLRSGVIRLSGGAVHHIRAMYYTYYNYIVYHSA
jgi:hypothetical protein